MQPIFDSFNKNAEFLLAYGIYILKKLYVYVITAFIEG